MSTSQKSIKLFYEESGDLRRISLVDINTSKSREQETGGINYMDLLGFITRLFRVTSPYKLSFIDDEDDEIAITNQLELSEAVSFFESYDKIMKITIRLNKATKKTTPSTRGKVDELDDSYVVHLRKAVDSLICPPKYMKLKTQIQTFLNDPDCQKTLTELILIPKFNHIFQKMLSQANMNVVECNDELNLMACEDVKELCGILVEKCPKAVPLIEEFMLLNIAVEEKKAQSEAEAVYRSEFVSDITYPDGSKFLPRTKFMKTWRLRNVGKTKWPENCKLIHVGGDCMTNGFSEIFVPSINPGSEIDISVEIVAPEQDGHYVGYWRLFNPEFESRFGHRIWVDLIVEANVTAEAEISLDSISTEINEIVQEDPWGVQLSELSSMGFNNETQNRELLIRFGGNLEAVINSLLG